MPISAESVRRCLADCRRLLVIKPSALGDVVQSLPILSGLRTLAPAAEVDWVIGAELRELVDGHPLIHRAIPFYRGGGLAKYLRLLEQLASARYDAVIDLQGLLRTAAMSIATAAPLRIGLETAREGASAAVHRLVPQSGPDVPAHARYGHLLSWLGITEWDASPHLPMREPNIRRAEELIAGLPRPIIAIHPGAKWVTKRWPTGAFASVIRSILNDTAGSVVLIGAPSEAAIADEVSSQALAAAPDEWLPRLRNLCGRTRLLDLAALLARVDRVLSNDSGPMHLAAAMGTPVTGLFTCTSAILSGPPPLTSGRGRHELLSATVPCAASYRKICPHAGGAHHACFATITAEQVAASLIDSF